MKRVSLSLIVLALLTVYAFAPVADKLVSKDGHISFYSHTDIEDIKANNFKVVSTIDATTGKMAFSVPMQSFEFEKALMQKHFNGKDFLNTKKHPNAKLVGKIDNFSSVDLTKDGTYDIDVSGDLEIKGVAKPIKEKATLTVNGGKVTLDSKMNVVLSDYDITFSKGKPSTNIAKEIEITVKAVYAQ